MISMKKSNFKNFTTIFGLAAAIIGLLLEVIAFIIDFDSQTSADGVIAGATLLAIGVAFLQSKSLVTELILLTISSLGFGYFVFVQTSQNWLWAILTTILIDLLLIYFLEVRSKIRQNHSKWF
ncbi:hypothetical protein C5L31_000272 [Secundilactobacillus malefermentans]|uniref:Uncharacterized protein n=2 Tax=Secundilactobacillus malefermentans TaxID=176292 RepID=A0A4R5NFT9_9LACO|nr:integral membrane protein [Secundilactobacillus malefermentans DSM 5705 = KCTC 3548]TDG72947.1 hypothetical protein C5L31_000272 [Secundilactobacillus malefermentans]